MAWQARSMEYDDDELIDRELGTEAAPSTYPPGLMLSLDEDDLEKVGLEGGDVGDTCHFSVMGEVTSCVKGRDGCRIELEVTQLAGEDGKFIDLSRPAHLSLCDRELAIMDLEADCELGDTIHLVGEARLESVSRYAMTPIPAPGEDEGEREHLRTATLQVTHLGYASDESQEAREG